MNSQEATLVLSQLSSPIRLVICTLKGEKMDLSEFQVQFVHQ